MNDDYLWDGSGAGDPHIVELERELAGFGYRAQLDGEHRPGHAEASSRWRARWSTLGGAVLAAAIVSTGVCARNESVVRPPRAERAHEAPVTSVHQSRRIATPASTVPESAARSDGHVRAPHARADDDGPAPARRGPTVRRRADAAARPVADRQLEAVDPRAGVYLDQAERCFAAAPLAPRRALVVMRFTVTPAGRVTDARLLRHTFADEAAAEQVGRCLATVLSGWRLPPPATPLELSHTFVDPREQPRP